MKHDVKIPSPGESINEVMITTLNKQNGDYVEKDEILLEVESEKATLTIPAEVAGIVTMLVKEEETVEIGTIACQIDTDAAKPEISSAATDSKVVEKPGSNEDTSMIVAPSLNEKSKKPELKKIPSIAAEKIIAEQKIDTAIITGTGKDGRITKQDVLKPPPSPNKEIDVAKSENDRAITRKKLTPLRKKIAERLVQVKNETAMLTTFNEVDMSRVMEIRSKYKDLFIKKYDVKLGFMSFFSKAIVLSLEQYPDLNAYLENDEILFHNYVDLGISVSAPKGLVVPVLRNAEQMQLHELEQQILTLADKARKLTISIDEMKGGTFTITNGGVFGSLLSTPILNPPQSGILGMHNIVDRPMAINGNVEIRPMMYVALSYDHRIVDGKSSVGFLKNVKALIEAPERMLLNI